LSGSRATNLDIQVALKTETRLIAPDHFNKLAGSDSNFCTRRTFPQ